MSIKPLLGPCDNYNLEPFSYPWAWEMAKNQEKNTWSPEEISVTSDMLNYKDPELDPKYKHLFESVMAQLTTFDIERGDDAAETFLSILQPAEIRHYMKRLVWDEALHTRSYRYVIENLGIPLTIYDRWREVPAMRDRVEMAWELSRPVEKLIGTVLLHGVEYHNLKLKGKQDLLRSMIFWFLVFEGVWFWVSLLGPVQQLARLGWFKKGAEQFQYIARDEASHIGFGISLIKEFMAQNPECVTQDFLAIVANDLIRAIELEKKYINYCLQGGAILGYSIHEHIATAKFFANMRMESIGFPQLFDDAYHAFPWMSEQMELKKEKNFFESRVTEYQTGGTLEFEQDDVIGKEQGWSDPLQEFLIR